MSEHRDVEMVKRIEARRKLRSLGYREVLCKNCQGHGDLCTECERTGYVWQAPERVTERMVDPPALTAEQLEVYFQQMRDAVDNGDDAAAGPGTDTAAVREKEVAP